MSFTLYSIVQTLVYFLFVILRTICIYSSWPLPKGLGHGKNSKKGFIIKKKKVITIAYYL